MVLIPVRSFIATIKYLQPVSTGFLLKQEEIFYDIGDIVAMKERTGISFESFSQPQGNHIIETIG